MIKRFDPSLSCRCVAHLREKVFQFRVFFVLFFAAGRNNSMNERSATSPQPARALVQRIDGHQHQAPRSRASTMDRRSVIVFRLSLSLSLALLADEAPARAFS